ncbi:MAG: putative dienelactone hydrolase [Myxococcota bacterium]|jgi:predicted dienelactone hydrolase
MRALLLLCLACSGDDKASDSAPPEVDLAALADTLGAPGPWARVGKRSLDTVWSAPSIATDREIAISVWYPSAAEARLTVEDDAAIAADGPFRVAVWSHGHQAYADAASHLCSHLASHGWIVVSPTHTGNTITDGADRHTAIYAQRPLDLSRALDAVLADATLGAAAHTAPGIIGLGHSFGGYTILAAAGAEYDPAVLAGCADGSGPQPFCSSMTSELEAAFNTGFHDDRFAAVVPMAPGDADLFGVAGLAAVDVPVLLMSGGRDHTGDKTPFWLGLDGDDDRWVHIERAGHNAFTDFPALLAEGEDLLPDADVWWLIDVYVGAFAATWTGDATPRPLLDGPSVSDDATLTVE